MPRKSTAKLPPVKLKITKDTTVSTSELSIILGKSSQWITGLTRDKKLSQVSRGTYVLSEAVQDYISHVEGQASNGISLADEKAEHEQIKRKIAALELAEKENTLHRAEDVMQAWSLLLIEFRKQLLTLPIGLATRLAGMKEKDIRLILQDELEYALEGLSQFDPAKGVDDYGSNEQDV